MNCPRCGSEQTGRFCADCGAALRDAACTSCGGELLAGARFCTHCGTPVAGAGTERIALPRTARSSAPWIIGALILLALAIILMLPMLTDDGDVATPTSNASTPFPEGAGSPPPLTGTPREQADRLFNRIMSARQSGDTAGAAFFVPMAMQAYDNARPLDADGLFHLGTIQLLAGDAAAARASGTQILEMNPQHLFGLALSAEAALIDGRTTDARELYQRFIDAYDTEMSAGRAEYLDHAPVLPQYLEAARTVAGS